MQFLQQRLTRKMLHALDGGPSGLAPVCISLNDFLELSCTKVKKENVQKTVTDRTAALFINRQPRLYDCEDAGHHSA